MTFSIVIEAPRSKVWETLWQDETFRIWASIIDPGTYMLGDLKEGSEVQFISSESGYGVTSLVEAVITGEYLLLRHRADTKENGQETRTDEWTGGTERYDLSGQSDKTTLTVSFDVPPEQEAYFTQAYPKALEQVKTLAEAA